MPRLHQYRVGMLFAPKHVEAPSPLAAAVFYGLHSIGHGYSMAAVFTEDGKPWRGEAVWMRWQLGDEPSEEETDQLRRELPFCRFIPKPKASVKPATRKAA